MKPKPKLLIKKAEPIKSNDISFYINVFGILVLIIGGLCLYQRLADREKDELKKQNTILGFHHYVQQNVQPNVQPNVQEDAVSTKWLFNLRNYIDIDERFKRVYRILF